MAELECIFPKEEIPNEHSLFQRVHRNLFRNEKLAISLVFKNHGDGMSTDWSKYPTPMDTKERVRIDQKDPDLYGVIKMNVGEVRAIEGQIVEHTPLNENRSHTDVKGDKTPKQTVYFNRIFQWSIKP